VWETYPSDAHLDKYQRLLDPFRGIEIFQTMSDLSRKNAIETNEQSDVTA